MADAAALAARRELRRRRILENAESRMKSFENVKKSIEQSNDQSPIKGSSSLDTSDNSKFSVEPRASTASTTKTKVDSIDSNQDEFEVPGPINEEELFGKLSNSSRSSSRLTSNTQMQRKPKSYRKLIIFILGIAIRYMNLVFENGDEILGMDLSYLHMGNIFVPFLIYEISEFFVCRPSMETSATLSLVLTLNNIRGPAVERIVRCVNNFLRVLKDMSVYFFAFVFLDMVFAVFKVDEDVV